MPPTPIRSFVRSFARPLARSRARRENFSPTRKFRRRGNFGKKSLGRCDRFRPRIVEIGAILAIFEPFEIRKFCTPFFGEFGRSSQDLRESDYDSPKSRDDRLDSSKSGMWIFLLIWWYADVMIIWSYDHREFFFGPKCCSKPNLASWGRLDAWEMLIVSF